MRLLRLCQILILAAMIHPFTAARAQTDPPVITPANVDQVVQVERLGRGAPRQIVFSPDASRLAVATPIGVWLITPRWRQANTPETVLLETDPVGIVAAAFNADASLIAAGADDGSVIVWDVASASPVARLENHLYAVGAVAWSSDESRLASGDNSGIVRLWDTASWSESALYDLGDSGAIRALTFDAAEQSLEAETSLEPVTIHLDTGEIQIWRGVNAPYVRPNFALATEGRTGAKAAWFEGETLRISQSGREVNAITGFYGALRVVFFQPNGQFVARADDSSWFWVKPFGGSPDWDAAGFVEIDAAVSQDGAREAIFENDGVIRLIDTASRDQIAALHGHIRAVTAVAFSPDGSLLASSSLDGTIQLWDATVDQDSGSLATLTGHNGAVADIAFSPDGTRIASVGYDGTLRLWGIRDSAE